MLLKFSRFCVFFFFSMISCSYGYSSHDILKRPISIDAIYNELLLEEYPDDFETDKILANALRVRITPKQEYHIFKSDERNFVWFSVYKVASATIKDFLASQVSDLRESQPRFLSLTLRKHYKFAFVRNTWDRLLSCYFHKIITKKSLTFSECFDKDFEYFIAYINGLDLTIANPHIKLQTRLIPVEQCDFIGKLDNFVEDFKHVCHTIGIEAPEELEHKHKTEHAHYSTYYKPWMIQLVAEMYKEEIEAFGFTFEDKN